MSNHDEQRADTLEALMDENTALCEELAAVRKERDALAAALDEMRRINNAILLRDQPDAKSERIVRQTLDEFIAPLLGASATRVAILAAHDAEVTSRILGTCHDEVLEIACGLCSQCSEDFSDLLEKWVPAGPEISGQDVARIAAWKAALVKPLVKYCQHEAECPRSILSSAITDEPCNCGLDAALAPYKQEATAR